MPRKKTGTGNNKTNINKSGLVSMADRPLAERQRIGRMGAIASNKVQRDKRTLREIARAMLEESASKDVLERLGLPEGSSNGVAVLASMMKSAVENENVKAAEYVRDTSGQAPTKEVKVSADVMTDADRALVEKVKNRIDSNKTSV